MLSAKIRILFLSLSLVFSIMMRAENLSENARVSLITCSPGEELYARYGHTAIRICDTLQDLDVVFNYGIFDFNTEHFYWRFVRGETWYELGATPTWWFMREYEEQGRPVYEQELLLPYEHRNAIWQALLVNYKPENRHYLYNFVFDNCATRPYRLIERAIGDIILSDYTGHTNISYRRFLRHYTGAHSWANAGINLLFGPKADAPMTNEQRLFLPEELMLFMAQAHLKDGSPIAAGGEIEPFAIASTPWYKSWEFGLALYAIIMVLISIYDRKRKRCSWGIDLAVGITYTLLLLVVTFLTFFSCHPLVGFGWRLFIIPIVHLCARLIYIYR